MNTCNLIAIDLGASSGRVMLATFCAENSALNLKELARFPNKIKRVNESDTWDLEAIEAIIKQTLEDISGQGIQISGIGIDFIYGDTIAEPQPLDLLLNTSYFAIN